MMNHFRLTALLCSLLPCLAHAAAPSPRDLCAKAALQGSVGAEWVWSIGGALRGTQGPSYLVAGVLRDTASGSLQAIEAECALNGRRASLLRREALGEVASPWISTASLRMKGLHELIARGADGLLSDTFNEGEGYASVARTRAGAAVKCNVRPTREKGLRLFCAIGLRVKPSPSEPSERHTCNARIEVSADGSLGESDLNECIGNFS